MPDRDLTPAVGDHKLSTYDRDPFEAFRRRMDHLFDAFWTPFEGRSFAPSAPRWVSVDLNETDKAYTVTAELPGIDERDIELTLRDNTLTLRGEKRDERKEGEGDRIYLERSYGRFERVIPLAVEIDAERAEAHCKNGVLTVVLPKSPEARNKTRRIEVRPQGAIASEKPRQ